jgi:hypothetical protein
MKKGTLILLIGLVLGSGAFAAFYYRGTAWCRNAMREPQPELAWLKKEFHLSNAEYTRVVRLHEAYLPECAKHCLVIDEQNRKLRQLLDRASAVTPEIQALLVQRARTRADCERDMLKHFVEVSRTMPAEQGKRYLAWVEQQTYLNGSDMERRMSNRAQPSTSLIDRRLGRP